MPHNDNDKENTQGVTHSMLAYILAIIIALTSIILYLSAFFLPELHRQDDFLWSSIGLFYALVLWVCAERITGGILLGQSAAVILVVSFGWQTVRLRRMVAYPKDQTDLAGFSVLNWVKSRLEGQKNSTVATTSSPAVETVTEEKEPFTKEISQPVSKEVPTEEDIFPEMAETLIQESIEALNSIEETETLETLSKETPESLISDKELPSLPPTEESIETPIAETEPSTSVGLELEKPKKKGFSLSSLFGFPKPKPQLSSEIITESSEQKELDIDKGDWENAEISEKPGTLKAKAVIEREITEALDEQEELATQQAKEENFELSEKLQTTTTIIEGTEVTPEEPLPKGEVILEGSEETSAVLTDDQPQINASFTIENLQEINSDTEKLETESSSSSFSDIPAQEKKEDKK